jgi:hypothetical protein
MRERKGAAPIDCEYMFDGDQTNQGCRLRNINDKAKSWLENLRKIKAKAMP